MSIKHAILGYLSWSPLTGYDIKKLFADTPTLYWSGSNNQIYRTLVDLHKNELVTLEVQHQDGLPSRKIYSITERGQDELRHWVQSTPELPQIKHTFLIQLAWADLLADEELDRVLAAYEDEVAVHLLMLREHDQRGAEAPNRTPREAILWAKISENWISHYEHELNWIRTLRKELLP